MRILVVLLLLAGCGADDPPAGGSTANGTITSGVEPL